MVENGWGLGWDMVAFQSPDGLDHMGGINVRRGEHGINRPGPDASQIDPDRRHSEAQTRAISDKPQSVGLGDWKWAELVEAAEGGVFPDGRRIGGPGIGGDSAPDEGGNSLVQV